MVQREQCLLFLSYPGRDKLFHLHNKDKPSNRMSVCFETILLQLPNATFTCNEVVFNNPLFSLSVHQKRHFGQLKRRVGIGKRADPDTALR